MPLQFKVILVPWQECYIGLVEGFKKVSFKLFLKKMNFEISSDFVQNNLFLLKFMIFVMLFFQVKHYVRKMFVVKHL